MSVFGSGSRNVLEHCCPSCREDVEADVLTDDGSTVEIRCPKCGDERWVQVDA